MEQAFIGGLVISDEQYANRTDSIACHCLIHTSPLMREAMVYANVIGWIWVKNHAHRLLATLLWLHVLAAKNVTVTWGYYFKVGVILTLPVLLSTLLALAGGC